MLQKWKTILANWIHCYFEEDTNKVVTLESLLNIISHLRENFNFDESKSSLLDAHTIHEFILEKYPGFRFDNGNLEPANEEEIYLTASLLLYFVCVNSKDLDIKKAMCSKLCRADQEIILKFSKCLMDCSNITCTDVLTAIVEACGQDAAASDVGLNIVAETPPALRSLHSEVRRLQAALDAERFDKNYLQEELARTNLKMDKLTKDKEQYKQNLIDLRAKVSTCGKDDSVQGPDESDNTSVKLVKQLEQAEQRLVNVQEQLDDVQYERDVYKNKLDDLKRECDKWIITSQEESSKACLLTEQLETERKNVQSLKDLVAELRQHNHHIGIDTSQLEWDDFNASMHSLLHNTSVCSEACANVIEVQLSEERAKVVLLKQQIQTLQDQLDDFSNKFEEERLNYSEIISKKDNDILNLKHRINEEIEEKNNLKLRCDDDVTKLNNEVNELEQRLRGNGENSRRIIDSKMKEIQTLQEEKLSLLESLTNKTTSLEDVIQGLKLDIDSEKTSKLKMREDYDNQLMKLNEKVLNRNNELVEFQNKIFEKGEKIEQLQFDLRKEKEMRDEVTIKYNNDITNLNKQIETYKLNLNCQDKEITNLKEQIRECSVYNKQLEKDIEQLRSYLKNYSDNNKILEECKAKLVIELESRDLQIHKMQKEMEHLECRHTEEKKMLQYSLDEVNATIGALKMQLDNEIQYKINIQEELHQSKMSNEELKQNINDLNEQIVILQMDYNKMQEDLDIEQKITAQLKKDCDYLNQEIGKLNTIIIEKESMLKSAIGSLSEAKIKFDEECREKDKVIDLMNIKLESEISNTSALTNSLEQLHVEKKELIKHINDKENIIINLQNDFVNLSKKIEDNENTIDNLNKTIDDKTNAYLYIQKNFDTKTTKLMTKLNEIDKSFKEMRIKSSNIIEAKELQIETQIIDIGKLQVSLQQEREKSSTIEQEKQLLIDQMNDTNAYKNKCEKEYLNKCALLNSISSQLNEEILRKNAQIDELKKKMEDLVKSNENKKEEIYALKGKVAQALQETKDITLKKELEIEELAKKNKDLEFLVIKSEKELKRHQDNNAQVVETLQRENVQLHYTIEEDNSNHELLIKEKDSIIEDLEKQLRNITDSSKLLQKEYENDKFLWEKLISDMNKEVDTKENQITQLTEKALSYETKLNDLETLINILNKEKTTWNLTLSSLRETCTESAQSLDRLKNSFLGEKDLKDSLENEKQNLIKEKESLIKQIAAGDCAYKVILSERESLLNEKNILVQQLMEEKSIRKIAEEEKDALCVQKEHLESQLRDVNITKNMLLQEKECLSQLLIEDKLAKDISEQEKKSITDLKVKLEEKLSDLERKNESLVHDSEYLAKQHTNDKILIQNLEKDISNLKQEVTKLSTDNDMLNLNISNIIKDELNLRSSVKTLTDEKEKLTKSCDEMKAAFDALTLENNDLHERLFKLNTLMESEALKKEEELVNLVKEHNRLVDEYKALNEDNEKVCAVINSGFNRALACVQNDNICEEILRKYVPVTQDVRYTDKCEFVFDIIVNLISEINLKKNLDKELQNEKSIVMEISEKLQQKELHITQLQDEVQSLKTCINNSKSESIKQNDQHNTLLETKARDIQQLKLENQILRNELNDVKVQLDVKVHSLKDKLIDNENLTDKLKKTYECQIDNLNVMITKLTNYLKEKTTEFDSMRNEKEKCMRDIEENNRTIKYLEEDLKNQKQNQEKLINDFESERLVLKNMVTVTESVMEDQKVSLNKIIAMHTKSIQTLEEEIKNFRLLIDIERKDAETKLREKRVASDTIFKELSDVRKEKDVFEQDLMTQKESFERKQTELLEEIMMKNSKIDTLITENKDISDKINERKRDIDLLEEKNNESKIKFDTMETEFGDKIKALKTNLDQQCKRAKDLEILLENKKEENSELHEKLKQVKAQLVSLGKAKSQLEIENGDLVKIIDELNRTIAKYANENELLVESKNEVAELTRIKEDMNSKIVVLEEHLQLEKNKQEVYAEEEKKIINECTILKEYQTKAEMELEMLRKEINTLQGEAKAVRYKTDQDLIEKDKLIATLKNEKDAIILRFEDVKKQSDMKEAEINALRKELDQVKSEAEKIKILENENGNLINAIGQKVAVASYEKSSSHANHRPTEHRKVHHQVDPSSDYSSLDHDHTISDLEKIIQDKNRTVATLQSDVTYLKSLIAESETKCLDITKELELSKENCQQLSSQLKKIVHQKNEEIADLKKQVAKMSAMENRATQIIKVSAKYQAIILKRIAEIKSNTVLKELTNFGNTNCDSELRRSLTSGTITMEDLENFLETTDRHLHRCSEKRHALQRDKERLTEVNRINESEIINMKKFLTELSVSIKTFNSVKDLYTQKLSRVVPLQRTVRREILSLDGHVTDAVMSKLERGYSAVMQDLSECALNLERWMERCISRAISSEKINQAFAVDEHASIASGSFQNTALEVQLEELQSSFQKLLAEVARAQKGETVQDTQTVTVMEVRAEYEDKLNRMKAKMKQLYQEQIALFKEKQREDIAGMELELKKTQKKLQDCEQHIKSLTTELWNVGEKYLMKKDEADWLRKKQHSGSLMSLQHVHSSGLVPPHEEPSRPSDTLSLRSLPVSTNNNAKEGRGLHMSDEEGEVFDNRWLRELATTPRRESAAPGNRISELRWRNSLCPPHLKSSYPAETQFAPAIHEEDIKCAESTSMSLGGKQRKEVGITAYKKPGPPTPSKQAGRLSATDSELRESLRIEADPSASRKTSTPSRIRSLFRSAKNDTADGTPRSRRLSNIIFRKK